jgi:acyl-CoA reductase-like NAD-dependent aldehyde dehydrogenase
LPYNLHLGIIKVFAWYHSFPYLVAINSVLPALIAGNSVILKPSPQTPLTAERFAAALTKAGVPSDTIQVVHVEPEMASYMVKHPIVHFISFTGSVKVGHMVQEDSAREGFKGIALEVHTFIVCLCLLLLICFVAWWKGPGVCETRRRSGLHGS